MKKYLFFLLFPLSVFSQTTALTFTPISTDINRPGGGAEQWTARQNTVNIPTAGTNTQRLDAYYRFKWANFQPVTGTQGVYDFTAWDLEIQDAIRKGQGFSFGIMQDCCGEGTIGGNSISYPGWLHTQMQAETHKDWNDGGTWSPNYNSVNWLNAFTALHQAIYAHILAGSYQGVRYRDVVKRIDIRTVGDYGEQTTQHVGPDSQFPTSASFIALSHAVKDAYPTIYCTNMIGAFSGSTGFGITPAAATIDALQMTNSAGPMGWRWDSWGWTDSYIHNWLENNNTVIGGYHADTAIMNRYKYAPVGGEPADLNNAGVFNDLPVRVVQYHAESFGNGNLDAMTNNVPTANNFRSASALAGYKIVVSSGTMTTTINQGSAYNITLQLKNVNGTPAYDSWKIVYEWWNGTNLLQRDTTLFDLKGFISTTDVAFSSSLGLRTVPAGTGYEVHVKVVDPLGYRIPMPLFITGRLADGGYPIRTGITVLTTGAIANAGNNQTTSGSSVTLNGSASSGATSYLWTQISGPNTATLVTPTTVTTSATGLIAGTYVFQLAINGGSSGQLISQTSVQVSLVSPIANAGNPQTITLPTSSATLNGTGSTGATTYSWTNVSGPNTPTLVTPALASTTVSGMIAGIYTFQLSINSGASTSQTQVTVLAAPAPSANAGASQTITLPTNSVTVTGAASTGTITSYAWSNVSGPNAPTFGTATAVSTTISNLIQGRYVIRLTLNGGTATDTLTITVNPAQPPTSNLITIYTTQTPNSGSYFGNQGAGGINVGNKFQSTVAGYITGVRFYKVPGMTGPHTGMLYIDTSPTTGTLLASGQYVAESQTGWQTLQFSTPVAILANTTYTVAMFTPDETFVGQHNYFNTAFVNGPLFFVASGGVDGFNGQQAYGPVPAFPSAGAGSAITFWIDVVFSYPNSPGRLINVYYKAHP